MSTGEQLARIERLVRALAKSEGHKVGEHSRVVIGLCALVDEGNGRGGNGYVLHGPSRGWEADVNALLLQVESIAAEKLATLREALDTGAAAAGAKDGAA